MSRRRIGCPSFGELRKAERAEAYERLDAMLDELRGLSMLRAAALGETSEWTVRAWARERGHADLFNHRGRASDYSQVPGCVKLPYRQ